MSWNVNKQNQNLLSLDELKSLLHYNVEDGVFTNLTSRKMSRIGQQPGYVDITTGYIQISLKGKTYRAHRLAWFYVHGEWPVDQIDHIDKNRTNNRIDNLRDVSNQINSTNQNKSKVNTSGVTGVYWSNYDKKWMARIQYNRKKLHLGYFDNKQDAINARKDAEVRFGFTND